MADIPNPLGYQPPPWALYHRQDETADILPAGRPGTVLERVPLGLAERLVCAAAGWHTERIIDDIDSLRRTVQEFGEVMRAGEAKHP
jgi:hypothetical protein